MRRNEKGQAEYIAMVIILLLFVTVFAGIVNFAWYMYAENSAQSVANRIAQTAAVSGQVSLAQLTQDAQSELAKDDLHGASSLSVSVGGQGCAQLVGGDYQGQLASVTLSYHWTPLLFAGGFQFLSQTIVARSSAVVTQEYAQC